jgi:ribonuclease P/MRP protein subunit RPP40
MYLDKETYERAGLVGKPHGAKGNRGLKPRWSAFTICYRGISQIHLHCIYAVVSYDLRSPSMLHGKKGFDRLVYASKKVLNQPLTWLFCNVAQSSNSLPPPFFGTHI